MKRTYIGSVLANRDASIPSSALTQFPAGCAPLRKWPNGARALPIADAAWPSTVLALRV